ncbi:MAG: DMT family transporter [Chloroflexi bacterium]|nr:DMT family transporter [Chloroflexota bacterium]
MGVPWRSRWRRVGTVSALLSAFFLGLTPIFGKLAIVRGMAPLGVAAWRTVLATLLLYLVLRVWRPSWLYIHRLGLLGCLLAGAINGLGSLFYYSALARIDASLGQLLYSLYPVFVGLWLWLDRQAPGRVTWVRLALAVPAVYLLTAGGASGPVDWLGVGMMLLASALYALHLPVNQRVLYEAPAPTVTLYTLAAMSGVVVLAYAWLGPWQVPVDPALGGPVLALTLVTFLSRLTLFLGVKHIGGMHTALLGLGELLVTVAFAHWWLGERLTPRQWLGAALLLAVLLLSRWDRPAAPPKPGRGGWLQWLEPPDFRT